MISRRRFPLRPRLIRTSPATRRGRRRLWPCLEAMEERLVLSTLTVTNTADSGSGSLRAEIAAASSGDTITFAPGLAGRTIHLTSGELAIAMALTIQGPASGTIDVDAGGNSRVFDITSAATTVAISNLTISGGVAEDGGGILDEGATLTLNKDVLINDQAIGANPGDRRKAAGWTSPTAAP